MTKEFTCILCPNGCFITAEISDNKIIFVDGSKCKKGREYVSQEIINPMRNIATSVKLIGGELPLVSVRLSKPIPMKRIFDVMNEIKKQTVYAPAKAGQVVITDVLGLNTDVIITKDVNKAE